MNNINNFYNSNLNKIINDGKLNDEHQVINDMEDLIINLYKTNTKSEILNNMLLLNDIDNFNNNFDNKFDKIKIYKEFNINNLNLESFIRDNFNHIVFTGSYQREIFVPNIIDNDLDLFINFIDFDLIF